MRKEAPDYANDPEMEKIRKQAVESHKGKPPERQRGENHDDGEENGETEETSE